MGGDGALAHGEDFLQFGDGKLLAAQEEQDAKAVGVGDDAEDFHKIRHGFRLTRGPLVWYISTYHDLTM
jgi:hypothetical protein